MAAHDPLDHVVDHNYLELPWWTPPTYEWKVELPSILGVQITRFMVMELIAAVLMVLILIPVVRHISARAVSRGGFMNAFEAMLMYIRDEVARPAIGGHGADHFLPYLWTAFFFVLFNNLLGMIPGLASPTGNVNVTAALAVMTLGTVLTAGIREAGLAGYFVGLVPHIDVPPVLKLFLWPLMFVIEVVGLLIKHIVLAVRLFANMFAGHVVLAVILGFILVAKGTLFYLVMPASITGVVLLSLLELLVAFLQAYIFTFLSALFIGSAVHPH
ncbi:MAG: F0F1 ATP synthase subunit A [Paludisphaera borealis]|uniref:F0F1 ATP synthase subunit A n=1 Tax=Paludisphaera borealis TaxID=1387353 RepID=UPI002843D7FF|nr:F0F1 ATP synthase subunit A [Paludisphaera borealis]MDR3617875.1 F0F1 ATP synthase subunit A [Paludisphaera borealis]